MSGEQVVRLCRAVAKHLAAFADDLEQITAADPQDTCKVGDPDPTPKDRMVIHAGQHVAGLADRTVGVVWT